MFRHIISRVLSWCMVALFFLTAPDLYAYEPDECLNCHSEGSGKSALHMSVGEYENSVHYGEISCMDCHAGVVDDAHMKKRGSGNVNCGVCHDQKNRHGSGAERLGVNVRCYACHTRHGIQGKDHPASSVHHDKLPRTCGACHPAQTGDARFLAWLPSVRIKIHGKQDFACDYDGEDCLGCHQGQGAHGEETPLNDSDCRKCHLPTNGRTGVMGNIHPKTKKDTRSMIAGAVYGVAVALLLIGGGRFYSSRFSQRHGKGKERG